MARLDADVVQTILSFLCPAADFGSFDIDLLIRRRRVSLDEWINFALEAAQVGDLVAIRGAEPHIPPEQRYYIVHEAALAGHEGVVAYAAAHGEYPVDNAAVEYWRQCGAKRRHARDRTDPG